MDFLAKYNYPFSVLGLNEKVENCIETSKENVTVEKLKQFMSLIDLTSLNSTDHQGVIEKLCLKVNDFSQNFPEIPNVAAICVYPNYASTVKYTLREESVRIAAVAAGFPSSQTFIDIKVFEAKLAIEKGATEIDIVLSVGDFLAGNYQLVFDEIVAIKKAIGKHHLKVILETGKLEDPLKIWEASMLAMNAGADFIKTSTGKTQPAATPEAAIVMCEAIKLYCEKTDKKVGFKPAGGISSKEDAALYYTIVQQTLGKDWLNPELFRIGASSLANKLLSAINNTEIKYF